jgi:hypothetical protein
MAEHEAALPPARYEPRDASVRYVSIGFAATLVLLLLATLLGMWIYPSTPVDRRMAGPLPNYPGPRLQSDPTKDLRRFVAAEMDHLNSSGWVNRANGAAHIPIDAAMRRVSEQGIPDWPAPREKPR